MPGLNAGGHSREAARCGGQSGKRADSQRAKREAMNLDNLSKRVVLPLLKAAGLEWHGWYSLRRGVSTTLAGLTRDAMASKGLLRHTNLATTTRHYVKDVPENTLSAMNQLESLFSDKHSGRPN